MSPPCLLHREDGTDTPVSLMTEASRLIKEGRKTNGARNMSANRRAHGRGKLLMPLSDRVRTPNVDDEVGFVSSGFLDSHFDGLSIVRSSLGFQPFRIFHLTLY